MNPRRTHDRVRRGGHAVILAAVVSLTPGAAQAQTGDGPLDQSIDADQPVVSGAVTLDRGHVDVGPRFVDGRFRLMVHDDSVVPSVWREVDDTVVRVSDAARQTVPDDSAYAFLGAAAGADVHVVPQVQHPDVVWLGWNTQDPEVMATVDRGATLTLLGVEGPGRLTMFLQAGNLTEPEVLWRSPVDEGQPIWVEINTHTHANWVFSEPGVYLVHVEVAADLVGGEHVSDTQTLRFAVGDGTSAEDARRASFTAPVAPALGDQPEPAIEDAGDAGVGMLTLVVVAAAVVLLGVVVTVITRGAGARRRVARERAPAGTNQGGGRA